MRLTAWVRSQRRFAATAAQLARMQAAQQGGASPPATSQLLGRAPPEPEPRAHLTRDLRSPAAGAADYIALQQPRLALTFPGDPRSPSPMVARNEVSPDLPPPPPSRTNWTRLVPPPVLTGHVSSLTRASRSRRAGRASGRVPRAPAEPPSLPFPIRVPLPYPSTRTFVCSPSWPSSRSPARAGAARRCRAGRRRRRRRRAGAGAARAVAALGRGRWLRRGR